MNALPSDTPHSLITGQDTERQMFQASADSSVNQCGRTESPPSRDGLLFVPGMLGGAKRSFEGIGTGSLGEMGRGRRQPGLCFQTEGPGLRSAHTKGQ